MSNLRLLYENMIDILGVSISVTSEEEELPVENIAHPFRTYKWRSTGDSDETVTIDLGAQYMINALVIIDHNFTDDSIITYQSSNDSDFDPLIINETLTWREGIIYEFLESNYAQYHRIRIQDSANPDTYLEIGRVFMGEYYEPEKNFHQKYSDSGIDLSLIGNSEGGQIFGDERDEKRKLSLNWSAPITINNEDKLDFQSFAQFVKTTKSFVIFLDPENLTDEIYYGRLVNRPEFRNTNNYNWWETAIEFEEVL